MRVTLDTNALYTTQAGVPRYGRGGFHGLGGLAEPESARRRLAWEVPNLEFRQPARAWRTAYRELVWTWAVARPALRRERPDVFHSTIQPLVVPPRGMPHVGTLHDLAILEHPERFRWWHRRASVSRLRRYRRMDRVICISRFTADAAVRLLGLAPQRVVVVHNGTDMTEAAAEQAPDFPVPAEVFLFVGSLEPGKNLALLRETYKLARRAGRELPPLLIVGARWSGVAGEGAPPANWHYLGRQPDGVLIHLYRRALALAFPSKYEGFGLPVAEAMQLGCPVVCSPVASLPEVAGDAALFVPSRPPRTW
ncbi:MAG TPA: glycosyltransferase family 1 protein, partial [Verrucomicrobiota bacterium]|nr:glycosyltransferase family 1 protein [Verrucomicrobiota bacterium]